MMRKRSEDALVKAVYQGLKENFEGVSGWIYEDYFKNTSLGYEHFLTQFQQDWPSPRSRFEDEEDFQSCVCDYVEEISSVLRGNKFINDFKQMWRE